MGESKDAERWAVVAARASSARRAVTESGRLLLRGGEYWIFSVAVGSCNFLDAWEHATAKACGTRRVSQLENLSRHRAAADGQNVFDFATSGRVP